MPPFPLRWISSTRERLNFSDAVWFPEAEQRNPHGGFSSNESARREGPMKPKNVYLLLCVLGALLPYSQFVPWVMENGLQLGMLVGQLFANRISAFFGLDVVGEELTHEHAELR